MESMGFPKILDLDPCLDLVPVQNHWPGRFFDADADGLPLSPRGPGVANDVFSKDEIFGFASNPNAGAGFFGSIIFNHIIFQSVAAARHASGLVSEKNTIVMV